MVNVWMSLIEGQGTNVRDSLKSIIPSGESVTGYLGPSVNL